MRKKKKRSDALSTALLLGVLLLGAGLLAYPTVSDWYNSFHMSRAIASYVEEVAQIDTEKYEALWEAAHDYNDALRKKPNRWMISAQDHTAYEELLNAGGSGVMASIEIPSIQVNLPVYHGVDDGVLQIAVGHIEGTSLPVGGVGTHCVVSGHRGLPRALLFTALDKLTTGDLFMFNVLDETLTYEVDQILIVEPSDVSALAIDPAKDYVTLVTCTPYGINTHRLLVRGHRVENLVKERTVHVSTDAVVLEKTLVAPFVAAPLILLVLLYYLVFAKKR